MGEDTALLRDILSTLREIRDVLRTGGGAPESRSAAGSSPSGKGGEVAGDRELDSEWGNPAVRKDPKRWTGPSYVGCAFSECPPEYLDELAGLFDWMADQDEKEGRTTPPKNGKPGKPTAPYKRRDAARARGWAQRIRNGWAQPPPAQEQLADQGQEVGGYGTADAMDDIPF